MRTIASKVGTFASMFSVMFVLFCFVSVPLNLSLVGFRPHD